MHDKIHEPRIEDPTFTFAGLYNNIEVLNSRFREPFSLTTPRYIYFTNKQHVPNADKAKAPPSQPNITDVT